METLVRSVVWALKQRELIAASVPVRRWRRFSEHLLCFQWIGLRPTRAARMSGCCEGATTAWLQRHKSADRTLHYTASRDARERVENREAGACDQARRDQPQGLPRVLHRGPRGGRARPDRH